MTNKQIIVPAMALTVFLVFVTLMAGCDTQIYCWYTSYVTNTYGPPAFRLVGRTTGRLAIDATGPIFISQEDLDTYIREHNLLMCAKNK